VIVVYKPRHFQIMWDFFI